MALTAGTYGFVTTSPTTIVTGRNDYRVIGDWEITLNKYTSPADANLVNEIGFFRYTYWPGGQPWRGVIYADNGGVPGALVGSMNQDTSDGGANTWERSSGSIAIQPSTDYWIGTWLETTDAERIDSLWAGATAKVRYYQTTLPNPLGTPNLSPTLQFVMYARYVYIPETPTGLTASDGVWNDQVKVN